MTNKPITTPFPELSANVLESAVRESVEYLEPVEDAKASLWLRIKARGWAWDIVARPRVKKDEPPPVMNEDYVTEYDVTAPGLSNK
jgi:hypothetical protein